MSLNSKATVLRWIDVPSTSLQALRCLEGGESGTGPADNSQRNTTGVVGPIAAQDRSHHDGVALTSRKRNQVGGLSTLWSRRPRRRSYLARQVGQEMAALEIVRLRLQDLYHMLVKGSKRRKVGYLARHCRTGACLSLVSGAPSQQSISNGCRNCCESKPEAG